MLPDGMRGTGEESVFGGTGVSIMADETKK
jgi:hypothetical protein